MTAFSTSDDMVARFDARTLGDICADNDVQVTQAGLVTNTKMLAALNTATGRLLATALRAKRYSRVDLNSLTGESLDYLKDLTCRIAFWILWQRKPYSEDQQRKEAKQAYDDALEELGSGHEIFDVDAVKDAGIPKVETVTRTEIETDWNLFVDEARGRFYPQRRTYKHR
jgi:phage gp36-like protein